MLRIVILHKMPIVLISFGTVRSEMIWRKTLGNDVLVECSIHIFLKEVPLTSVGMKNRTSLIRTKILLNNNRDYETWTV